SDRARVKSVTAPVARWTHAVATLALVVPPARGPRRMVSRPTVHTALARSTLAMSRGAFPAEPTVSPGRQPSEARRGQQHDETCSQTEPLQPRPPVRYSPAPPHFRFAPYHDEPMPPIGRSSTSGMSG